MQCRGYVIKGRFTGTAPQRRGMDGFAFLGRGGRWCSVDKALKFSSVGDGEYALHETWCRLRNAGDRSIILSVEKLPCGNENNDRARQGT